MVHSFDKETVIVHDKYPKARKHLLVMPRKEVPSLVDLTRDDVPILENMKEKAEALIQEFASLTPSRKPLFAKSNPLLLLTGFRQRILL